MKQTLCHFRLCPSKGSPSDPQTSFPKPDSDRISMVFLLMQKQEQISTSAPIYLIPNPHFEGLSPTVRLTYLGVFQTISFIKPICGSEMKGKHEERAIQIDTYLTLKKKGLARSLIPSSRILITKKNTQSSNFPAGPLLPPSPEALSVILLSVHSAGSSIRVTLEPRS